MQIRAMINEKVFKPLGYEINNLTRQRYSSNGWEQYKFIQPDGSFDYEQYKKIQVSKAVREQDVLSSYVNEPNIAALADYLKRRMGRVKNGICHGAKKGAEIELFMKHLGIGARVLGTDIAPVARTHPDMIQWDFHETKAEWLGAMDFVYSNALDHSYEPEKAVNAWLGCVRPGGYCLIDWHVESESVNITDPFAADVVQLLYAITRWGRGRYCVRELIAGAKPHIVCLALYKF